MVCPTLMHLQQNKCFTSRSESICFSVSVQCWLTQKTPYNVCKEFFWTCIYTFIVYKYINIGVNTSWHISGIWTVNKRVLNLMHLFAISDTYQWTMLPCNPTFLRPWKNYQNPRFQRIHRFAPRPVPRYNNKNNQGTHQEDLPGMWSHFTPFWGASNSII